MRLEGVVTPFTPTANSQENERHANITPLNAIMGHRNTSFEEKIRLAIRAAKFEETPKGIWLKVLPTIAEGVSTTRANEMFCWARSMILDQERGNGLSEPEAHRNMVQRLLASDDGHGCSVTRIARDKSGASADRFTSAKAS